MSDPGFESSSACRSCHAPIVWAVTEAGRPIPLNPDPEPAGNLELVTRPGQRPPVVHVLTASAPRSPDVDRYQSHFATCPNANEWRRRRPPPQSRDVAP
jgi:hypothetical protein